MVYLKRDEEIKIGFLGDSSGDFSIYGLAQKHAAELAIKEINDGFTLFGGHLRAPGKSTFTRSASTPPTIRSRRDKLRLSDKGDDFSLEKVLFAEEDKILLQSGEKGLLGKTLSLIFRDSQSQLDNLESLTNELVQNEKADVIFGGFTSASRERIRPVINKHKQLYFYTNQYEGGVSDKYTFCTGTVCEQQVLPLLQHMVQTFGPRIYTIAADYNFGRLTAAWTKSWAPMFGGEVIEESFIPVGVSNFEDVIARVKKQNPDWVMTLIIGEAQQNYYPQASAAHVDKPMATTVNMASGYEHIRFNPPAIMNMHNAVNYMMEIPSTRNIAFVKRWFNLFPDDAYIGQMAQNTYFSIHLYAKAVRLAGTADQQEVINALESGLHIEAPEGSVFLDPSTHHVTHYIRLAVADEDHNIKFIKDWPNISPWWLHRLGVNLIQKSENKLYTLHDDPYISTDKDFK